MQISFRWTDGSDPVFLRFYRETEAYYNSLVGGEENRKAFIPYNLSESITDVLIASDGDIPVGCAGLKKYSAGDVEVKRVWVEPAYRGNRVALRMMERLEAKAREKGFSRTILQTRPVMEDAVALYRRLGYHLIPDYPPYDRLDGVVCLAKDLCPGQTECLH